MVSDPFDGFEPWQNYQGSEPDLAVSWTADESASPDSGSWTLWDTENDGMILTTPDGPDDIGGFPTGGITVFETDTPDGTDQ